MTTVIVEDKTPAKFTIFSVSLHRDDVADMRKRFRALAEALTTQTG